MTTIQSINGILAIWHDCAPGREAEFETWFQHEHLDERLAVPGFLFGRRHEALSDGPRNFTLYVTETADTLTSPAYLERLNTPTPQTKKVMSEIFTNMSRTVCRRELQAGRLRGSIAVTSRFTELPEVSEATALMNSLIEDPGVARVELWRAAESAGGPVAEEERMRGGDQKIGGCLMVETLRERDAETVASDLSRRFPDAETGIYRVLCQIGHGEA